MRRRKVLENKTGRRIRTRGCRGLKILTLSKDQERVEDGSGEWSQGGVHEENGTSLLDTETAISSMK